MDRTRLIALWLRLTVLVFAVSWTARAYQVFGDGIGLAVVGLWILVWAVKKIWKRRKERKDEA